MKKLLSILLALLLLAVPALADEAHEAHTFAPEGAGISLMMDDSWFHELEMNLYAAGDRSSDNPCEYSDLFFIYVDPANSDIPAEGLLILSLSNRIKGSDHIPNTYEMPPFSEYALLAEDAGRELLLWYHAPENLPACVADKVMLPVNRLLENPADVTLSEPATMPVAAGFDALYGFNAVDQSPVSADVFTGKKLTMINVWATYCNPCIAEMPELAQLNRDYADKGFQVIGVLSDVGAAEGYDAETLDYANVIIDSTGADYLHVIPGQGMFLGALSDITAVPTSYFVDETGAQVGEAYVGSRNYAGWAAIVDDLLASME